VIHVDTSYLIDLGRELHRDVPGPATEVLLSLGDTVDLAVSVHAICELLAGAERARRPARERRQVETVLQHVAVVYPGPAMPTSMHVSTPISRLVGSGSARWTSSSRRQRSPTTRCS
jgi:hypothetical protein